MYVPQGYVSELLNRYKTYCEDERKKCKDDFNKMKESFLNKGINEDDFYQIGYSFYSNEKDIDKVDKLERTYPDMVRSVLEEMASLETFITNLFGDESNCRVNYTEGTVRFIVPSKRLSTVVMTLASYFGWKPTSFGFSSSFTTHEGKTKFDKIFNIGLDPDNRDNGILIDYNLIKGDPQPQK